MKTITNTEFKPDKVFNRELWNGIVVKTYQKTIDNSTYSCNSLEELKTAIEKHRESKNTGASNDYGKGLYNGD